MQAVCSGSGGPYSVIEHVARCCSGSARWEDVRFAMFTVALDASGKKNDCDWVVVAGFAAGAGTWQEFEGRWNERLRADGIAYFHMKEFTNATGQFQQWRGAEHEPRRRALVADLIGLLQEHACRLFGYGIAAAGAEKLREAHSVSRGSRSTFILEAHAIGAWLCAKDAYAWAQQEKIPELEVVFDEGDGDRERICKIFSFEQWRQPLFRPSREMLKGKLLHHGFTPLQGADLLANEIYQKCQDFHGNAMRWPLAQFRTMPGRIARIPAGRFTRLAGDLRQALSEPRAAGASGH